MPSADPSPQGEAAPDDAADEVAAPGAPVEEPWPDGPPPSAGLIRLDLWGTVVFTVLSVLGAAFATPATVYPAAISAGVLAVAGCVAFAWGYVIAVSRSRFDEIDLPGLFFLSRSAPPTARRPLLGLLAVQVVVGIGAAAVRPFTALAFCVLAPVFGLGLITLWSARNGRFPPRGEARPAPPVADEDGDRDPHDQAG